MADLNDRPKRAPRASKRVGVAVPFMPDAAIATPAKPIAAVIEEIAHLPIDEPAIGSDAVSGPEQAAHAQPTPELIALDVQAPAIDPTATPQVAAEPVPASTHVSDPIAARDEPAASPIQDQATAAATAPTSQEDDTMTDTMQNATDTMQNNADAAMNKGKRAFEDMTAFGQGNVEAMVESTRVAFKGMESMAQARAAFAKQSFDATVQTFKAMAEVRSPADLFKLQGEYLRTSMDALVAETSRSTEATLKLVGEVAQPIQNRVALAAEKVRSAA